MYLHGLQNAFFTLKTGAINLPFVSSASLYLATYDTFQPFRATDHPQQFKYSHFHLFIQKNSSAAPKTCGDIQPFSNWLFRAHSSPNEMQTQNVSDPTTQDLKNCHDPRSSKERPPFKDSNKTILGLRKLKRNFPKRFSFQTQ